MFSDLATERLTNECRMGMPFQRGEGTKYVEPFNVNGKFAIKGAGELFAFSLTR